MCAPSRYGVARCFPTLRDATSSERAMLTAEHIATRLGCSARWVRERYIPGWLARQHDPRVPRVRLQRTARTGRPRYLIDRDSFERWLCPQAEAA